MTVKEPEEKKKEPLKEDETFLTA
jgi:hypothetical protein